MAGSRPRFKHWCTKTGLKTLTQLMRREIMVSDLIDTIDLYEREDYYINFAVNRLPGKLRRPAANRQLALKVRRLASELDIFREGDFPASDTIKRLDDPSFKGKREHFMRLLSALDYPEAWNRWRKKSGEVPDLRGADLGGIDLILFDLSHARLSRANLSASVIRTGELSYSDLRECDLRHTDLSYAYLNGANLMGASLVHTLLTGAELRSADMRRSFLVGTSMNQADLTGADLRGAVVWGTGAWDIDYDETTKQKGLLVVPWIEPLEYSDVKEQPADYRRLQRSAGSVRVNDIKVAHFMSLLIQNPMIGKVINASVSKVVLLLGRFSGQEKLVLDELQLKLRSFGYVPVVFDFKEPEDRDTIETVSILAGLSNFVIANLSQPRSTPLEAQLVIPSIAVPFVPIVREGEEPFSMFTALQRKYSWVLPTVTYRDEDNLMSKLKKRVIMPAEKAAKSLRRLKHPKKNE